MKKLMLSLAMLALLGAVLAAPAAAAEEAPKPVAPTEKIELFNGKDLSNWNVWLKEPGDPTATFKVEDSLIKCTGAPFGYIRSKEAYTDYVLTVEWRFVKDGNTGVIIHVSGPDKTWPKGLELQGKHGAQGNLVAFDDVKFEGMKGISTPRAGEDTEKPIGEWNVYRAVSRGDTVRVFLNGKLVNTAPKCTVTGGNICLQSEGGAWECRKVTLEPLKAAAGKTGKGTGKKKKKAGA